MKIVRFLTPRAWITAGVFVISGLGALSHFVFELSGGSVAAAVFTPVNESVWEHLKMAYWPMLVWWIAGYYVLSRNKKITPAAWFCALAGAELFCLLFITGFFYAYTGALGIQSVAADIASFFLAVALSQAFGFHLYRYSKARPRRLIVCVAALTVMAAAFIVFTFAPPRVPLFFDTSAGTYGIP